MVALTAVTAAVALAGCGSGGGSAPAAGGADRVAVDVGNGTPIQLKKGALKIGIFMNDTQNEWELNLANTAKATAESYGWTADIITPGFDVQKQLNQVQTAATNKTYDAVVAVPVDGGLTCNAFTKNLPKANTLVVIGAVQMCGNPLAENEALWTPGTLTWVGGTGTSAQFIKSWYDNAAKTNPGPQNAVMVVGPDVLTVTQAERKIYADWSAAHPDFKITQWLNTNFTTPDTYQKSLAFLKAHPEITVIMSTYSPDMTRGVVEALKAAGKQPGETPIVDSGGSKYSFDEINSGYIQWTSPLFPKTTGKLMVEAVKAAQDGKSVPKLTVEIPPELGNLDNIPVFTKSNMSTFTPEF
jgi:ABC-type sugar transport system substrate-binding protein